MNIGSAGYPASALSNFAPHHFVFDGVECASMEGLLQSFKFDKPHVQEEVCKLVGLQAKRRGQKRNKAWKRVQKLWWKGIEYGRHGLDYQQLLDRAFEALAQSDSFRRALAATGNNPLTHSIGKSNRSETCITEREFCSRLERVRARLQKGTRRKKIYLQMVQKRIRIGSWTILPALLPIPRNPEGHRSLKAA